MRFRVGNEEENNKIRRELDTRRCRFKKRIQWLATCAKMSGERKWARMVQGDSKNKEGLFINHSNVIFVVYI